MPALAPLTGGRGAQRDGFTVPGVVLNMTAEAVFFKVQPACPNCLILLSSVTDKNQVSFEQFAQLRRLA
jgi:hypothetical protein